MRVAGATRAVGREAMRERQRRGRIVTPAMRARYPRLASLQVDFEFTPGPGPHWIEVRRGSGAFLIQAPVTVVK